MTGDVRSTGQSDPVAAPTQTVINALRAAACAGIERLDAHLLLADLLGCSRTWLLTHEHSALDQTQSRTWTELLERRSCGEPLAYLLRRQEFFGLMLQVGPAVLVPRPDTETLVEWAIELLRERASQPTPTRVIDLGCGSGAIALAVKSACPGAALTALDISEQALAVARSNAARLQLAVDWRCSDWWSSAGDARFDLAIANPPYIAANDPHLAALHHEPILALVAGDDGLTALRQVIAGAPPRLHALAWLLLEHGYQQAASVSALLQEHGFECVQTRTDLAGRPRCTGGRWPGAKR